MTEKKTIPIKIEKLNSSTFQLTKISTVVLDKISEKFSYLPEAYKFNPKFRLMGIKGVKIRMIQKDGTFPSGLLKDVVSFIKNVLEKEIEFSHDVEEHLFPLNDLFDNGINEDIFSNFLFDGNPVILRDYQINGVEKTFQVRNGLFNLSTGAGKCLGGDTVLKIKIDESLIKKYYHLFSKVE